MTTTRRTGPTGRHVTVNNLANGGSVQSASMNAGLHVEPEKCRAGKSLLAVTALRA
jgi:hypothetical protein